nr:hypothetical protein [Tanacetum cinerariifolium]
MVVDLRYLNSLKLEVVSLTSELETQKTQFVNEIDRLSREYNYADHMNAILVQTPGSGISILLAVGTPSTGSGNLYCQWELSPDSGNALCILFPTILP